MRGEGKLADESKKLIPTNEEDWFKEELEFFWNKGLTAKEIYKEMELKTQYNMELWHVYYLVKKFNLPKRNGEKKQRPPKVTQEMPIF